MILCPTFVTRENIPQTDTISVSDEMNIVTTGCQLDTLGLITLARRRLERDSIALIKLYRHGNLKLMVAIYTYSFNSLFC